MVVLDRIGARSWTLSKGEREGETLTRMKVTADEVGASLRWATATLAKASGRHHTWEDAPAPEFEDDEPTF